MYMYVYVLCLRLCLWRVRGTLSLGQIHMLLERGLKFSLGGFSSQMVDLYISGYIVY